MKSKPEFYPGWTDDYSARQRALGKDKLLPLSKRQTRIAARNLVRASSLQRIQASIETQTQRMSRLVDQGQGIPVDDSA